MTVYFIGAGPGAYDLITVRGLNLIKYCPICLYAGSLVSEELIAEIPPTVRLVNTGHLDLDAIVEEFINAEEAGMDVARLHSGDPSIYSAIGEQMAALDRLSINYEVVPGVSAYAAAAAAMKQELTLPALNQSLVLTRTAVNSTAMPELQTLTNLGKAQATMAIHLSAKNIAAIQEELLPIYGSDCPVVVAYHISWPDEKIIHGKLSTINKDIKQSGIEKTAIIFVGRALEPDKFSRSSLYAFAHGPLGKTCKQNQ